MEQGRIIFKLNQVGFAINSRWKVFLDGNEIGSIDFNNGLEVMASKGQHMVKYKVGAQSTKELVINVGEEDVIVTCVWDGSVRNFYATGSAVQYSQMPMGSGAQYGQMPNSSEVQYNQMSNSDVSGYGQIANGKANARCSKKKRNRWIIGIIIAFFVIAAIAGATGKKKKTINEFLDDYNQFYDENLLSIVENDDNNSYKMIKESLVLKAEYFQQSQLDKNVLVAKYINSDGVELFDVMLYMNDDDKIVEVRIGTMHATHPNGEDGAYELLRLLSYGCIYAIDDGLDREEITDLFKEACTNEGKVIENEGVEYYAGDDGAIFSFIITIEEN